MKISSHFDSGNIEVVDIAENGHIKLNINTDSNSEFKQWFYFRANGNAGERYNFEIMNAKDCSYVGGWKGYQAVASYDGDYWFRVETEFTDEQTLSFSHQFQQNSVMFAYFAPYTYDRHMSLVHNAQLSSYCQHQTLGETVDGRDIDLLVIGDEENAVKIWVIARQHPGETMAEWCAEGFIERLLNDNDPIAHKVLQKAVFYIVPNMNVDGSVRGNLRSNAAGANLNREWQSPSVETSPEVFYVRQKMLETGVDAFLDLHGDEGLPYVFVAASEGNPSYNQRIADLESEFNEAFLLANPDFQTEFGYPKEEPGQANLTVASNWVGEQFDCLSLTLEMPFKDNANIPNQDMGWSAERSYLLGETLLNPIHQLIDKLRK